jgi:hypothetical protein
MGKNAFFEKSFPANDGAEEAMPEMAAEEEEEFPELDNAPEAPAFCFRCGLEHLQNVCPAERRRCRTCRARGHFARTCHFFDPPCPLCLEVHWVPEDCPAASAVCFRCGAKGHYRAACQAQDPGFVHGQVPIEKKLLLAKFLAKIFPQMLAYLQNEPTLVEFVKRGTL